MHESSSEPIRTPEPRERGGVFYALTDDGIELPVVDVTHPAFAVALTEAEQRARVDAFLHEMQPLAKLPAAVRRPLLRFLLRGSVLAHAMDAAWKSYLSGMGTYLFKLGPENLTYLQAKPVDRKIAAALPGFCMRLRLADIARLLADAARPALAAAPSARPLHLLNIAGGTAIDSLNALILLRREHPALLEGRHVEITVLDLDTAGPHFGARALAALVGRSGPLAGLDARFRRVHYDWSNPTELVPVLEEARAAGAVTCASSEGGLFEYGSDTQIRANLGTLHAGTGADFRMVGSVTRADAPMQRLREWSPVPTVPRGLDVFRAVAEKAHFRVERAIERPFSDHVVLAPCAGPS
jgi:hypothetical protein